LAPATTRENVMVEVLVPKVNAVVGALTFELPQEVHSLAQTQPATQATLANGQPLPKWISFNPTSLKFEAKDVPPGQFPMQVSVQVGGQKVMVTISEHPN
jgi:hypothetical protein